MPSKPPAPPAPTDAASREREASTDGAVRAELPSPPREVDGREKGLDPTRYGDWEKNGRCIDF